MHPAKGHIDQRVAAEAEKVARGEKVEGRYLTYFLSQTGLPMKTIYSNVTELLLAGVDTVRTTALPPLFTGPCRRFVHRSCAVSDLQHHVLVALRAVPSPRGAGVPPRRGAERAGGSKRTGGSRCGPDASAEGYSQRSAQVRLTRSQVTS